MRRLAIWPSKQPKPALLTVRVNVAAVAGGVTPASAVTPAAPTGLFTRQSASQLTNTLVYEVQQGTMLLVRALLTLVKDSLTLVALLAYLLWLNWQLTLFVGVLFPVLALVMRVLGRRLRLVTVAGQQATDELAYVVEENVLAWRIVRLHGAEAAQTARTAALGEREGDALDRAMASLKAPPKAAAAE